MVGHSEVGRCFTAPVVAWSRVAPEDLNSRIGGGRGIEPSIAAPPLPGSIPDYGENPSHSMIL